MFCLYTLVLNFCIIQVSNEAQKESEDNKMMNWKIIGIMYPSKFEEPKESVIAEFETFVNAEDFINLVLPKEKRDRFRIEHI